MQAIEAMKTRLDICYLAGKCIEASLDSPERKNGAKFLSEHLTEIEKNRSDLVQR